jgi:hypothetical protein
MEEIRCWRVVNDDHVLQLATQPRQILHKCELPSDTLPFSGDIRRREETSREEENTRETEQTLT